MGDLKTERNEYDERYEILVEEIIKEFNIQREFERELLNTFVTEARETHNKYHRKDIYKLVSKTILILVFGCLWIYYLFHTPFLTKNYNEINNQNGVVTQAQAQVQDIGGDNK